MMMVGSRQQQNCSGTYFNWTINRLHLILGDTAMRALAILIMCDPRHDGSSVISSSVMLPGSPVRPEGL